ncbi:MAG: hypothetical protein IJM45_01545, partial [Clostridia bacterium]|nr:hypothetical protein [Clostridia bacterium]
MLFGKTAKVITAVLLAAVFSLCAISAAFAAGDETGATVKVYVPVEAPTAGGNYIIATDFAGANGTDGGGVYTHVIYDERLSLSDAGEDYSHNLLFVLDKTYLSPGSDYGIDAQYVIAPSEADKYNVFTFSQGAKNGSFLIEHEDRVPYFGPRNDETPDETALPSGGSTNAYYGVGADAKANSTYKTKIFFFWGTDIDETTTGNKPVAANHSSKGITFRYYKRNSINFCLWLNCRSNSGGELEIRGNTCRDSFYTSAEVTRGYDFTLYEEREVAVAEETTEHVHAWDDGEVTIPATCEGEGVKTFSCANCDETMTEPIPAKGHSYVSTVIPPTCTEDGYTLWECENCDASYTTDTVGASGHDWDDGEETTPATCEGEGVKTFSCANCDETMTEPIPANGHSYVSTVIPPTCTEDGYTLWECENCDSFYTSDEVGATGHKWDNGTVTTPATCEGDGVKTFTCECGETKTETILANGHIYVPTVIAPTCTEDGYTLWECENCDASYTSDPVTASGHAWGEGAVTTPATCEGEGVRTFTCACGETKTETIPANGHSFVPTVIAPTCT